MDEMITDASLRKDSPVTHQPPFAHHSLKTLHRPAEMENGSANSSSNCNLIHAFKFAPSSKPLFILPDGAPITYGQFENRVINYATCLKGHYGVQKGDRIAAQVTKSSDSIALYLATLRIGAIYVPLNTDYKIEEIRYFLTDASPRLFVCRQGDKITYRDALEDLLTPPTMDSTQSSHPVPLKCPTNGHLKGSCTLLDEKDLSTKVDQSRLDDVSTTIEKQEMTSLAAICYTSGTTGKPKGAMITHGNLLSNAIALCATWRINENDVLLHALPIYHVHGLFVAVNTILLKGASMIFLPKYEADLVANFLSKATIMMGVPTYYTRLLQCPKLDHKALSNVRLFISGSAPLLENTWNEFKERTGHEILERYGMTEGQMVCSNPYEGKRKPGTVGRPLPLVTARIRNGILEYKGPNLFAGYWKKPEKTNEDFTEDGFFISGDLADMDEDGYVRILGRGKDLIITGGLNVYPKEVENVIDALPNVLESAVIGVPHPDFGEAVVAVVVTNENPTTDESELMQSIINELKAKMARFKVPKRVFVQNQLPRNTMGKIQKNVLRERYQHIFEM